MKLKKGFTLIELLVVIAIIAILAAILFPVLSRARVAARVTQTISNSKQINLGFQMYMGDNDETFPLWTAGMGCTPATCDGDTTFSLRRMYPSLVGPYVKNGVRITNQATGEGTLGDIWGSPNSKPSLSAVSNTYAYNHWTLGGFSSCARNIDLANLPGACTGRTTAQYAEFADASYNTPANLSSLAFPAETIVLHDGAQLSRPPQYGTAFPGNGGQFIAVWGPHDTEGGLLCAPGNVPSGSTNAAIRRFEAGKRTVVSFADSSVKNVPTQTLYGNQYYATRNTTCTGAGIIWRGNLTNNRGWSRDWGGN